MWAHVLKKLLIRWSNRQTQTVWQAFAMPSVSMTCEDCMWYVQCGLCLHVCMRMAQNRWMGVLATLGAMSDTLALSRWKRGLCISLPFLSISNNLLRNHSLVHRQAEWVWAPSLQTNGVTCHFYLLAHSCEPSSYASTHKWHLAHANHNSYCAEWKIPILLSIYRKWH